MPLVMKKPGEAAQPAQAAPAAQYTPPPAAPPQAQAPTGWGAVAPPSPQVVEMDQRLNAVAQAPETPTAPWSEAVKARLYGAAPEAAPAAWSEPVAPAVLTADDLPPAEPKRSRGRPRKESGAANAEPQAPASARAEALRMVLDNAEKLGVGSADQLVTAAATIAAFLEE